MEYYFCALHSRCRVARCYPSPFCALAGIPVNEGSLSIVCRDIVFIVHYVHIYLVCYYAKRVSQGWFPLHLFWIIWRPCIESRTKKDTGRLVCILELWEVLVLHSEYIILIFWRNKVIFLFLWAGWAYVLIDAWLRGLGVLSYKSMILGIYVRILRSYALVGHPRPYCSLTARTYGLRASPLMPSAYIRKNNAVIVIL